jgi:hypothetical protein
MKHESRTFLKTRLERRLDRTKRVAWGGPGRVTDRRETPPGTWLRLALTRPFLIPGLAAPHPTLPMLPQLRARTLGETRSMPRDTQIYLRDILRAIERVTAYTAGMDSQRFAARQERPGLP